ncbi:hypothetical protein K438DRAFT_1884478 [Mycena galopus ATCC 62051]|nr:hypothetical protein K438DRAFT_1884478 [Mycena galopus ATCC 62051]
MTSDAAVHILSSCPCLQTCRLAVNDDAPSVAEDRRGAILEFPSLDSLDIFSVNSPVNRMGGVFSRISLPELRHLTLRGFAVDEFRGNLTYFPFLTISPRLENLVTDTNLFDESSLADLLRTLPPTLQQFQLICRDSLKHVIDDDALAALTPSADRPFNCPILQELRITDGCTLSDEALLRFITARLAFQPATLRCVEIHFAREMQPDIRPDIQPFLDAGLQLKTRYHNAPTLRLSPWQGLADNYL